MSFVATYTTDKIMATNKLQHRAQLANCIADLANRAGELNEIGIQSILLTVAGSIADGSDEDLSFICADFARLRLLLLQMEKQKPEDTDS